MTFCHVCGRDRPEDELGTFSRRYVNEGVGETFSTRFCIERPICRAGAPRANRSTALTGFVPDPHVLPDGQRAALDEIGNNPEVLELIDDLTLIVQVDDGSKLLVSAWGDVSPVEGSNPSAAR